MKPPDLTPECPRGHAPGTSADRRLVAVGLVLVGAPFLIGATWSVMIANEAIGPLITLLAWIAILVFTIRTKRIGSWIEVLPVIGGLVMLQLLLDLHTPYMGDIVIATLHGGLLCLALVTHFRERRAQKTR